LNELMPEHMFISWGSPHLTSQFCKVELGSTQNSKRDKLEGEALTLQAGFVRLS